MKIHLDALQSVASTDDIGGRADCRAERSQISSEPSQTVNGFTPGGGRNRASAMHGRPPRRGLGDLAKPVRGGTDPRLLVAQRHGRRNLRRTPRRQPASRDHDHADHAGRRHEHEWIVSRQPEQHRLGRPPDRERREEARAETEERIPPTCFRTMILTRPGLNCASRSPIARSLNPLPGLPGPGAERFTSRSGAGTGSGRTRISWYSEKIAVVAPMPSASIKITINERPGRNLS